MRIQFTVTEDELTRLNQLAKEGGWPSVSEYCKCKSLEEKTTYASLYSELITKVEQMELNKPFVLRDLISTPPALIGRWFYENVSNGTINVTHIGKDESGAERYVKEGVMDA